MGTISLSIPLSGQPNSTEDPKVASDFTTLQTLVNGNIDTNNISATAGIVAGQLALGTARLKPVVQNSNTSVVDGNMYLVGTAGITLTLPTATAGVTIGFTTYAGVTGASPLTITRSGGAVIGGVGVSALTSVVLGTVYASMTLWSDGANWYIICGQQDTGWVVPSYTASWVGTGLGGYDPVQVRLIGDRVWVKGAIKNATGGTVNGPIPFTVAAPFIPSAARGISATNNSTTQTAWQAFVQQVGVGVPGQVSFAVGLSITNGVNLIFDGASYTL